MHVIQYTIRNIPPQLDKVLRKRAKLTGKSLNRIIIEELASNAGVVATHGKSRRLSEKLDWFIGSGIDDETLRAIAQEDRLQKQLMAKKLQQHDT